MKTINDFSELIKLAEQNNVYVRWSRGPEMDKAQGKSKDKISGQFHNGLSCQKVHADRPELAAQMVVEYQFLRRKDSKIYGWVFTGAENGTDSDNAPTVNADSIKPIARIGEKLIERLDAYKTAWWAHRNYKPKTWAEGQDHVNNYPKLSDYI